MSGRKTQIDWEAIERDYRVGSLSVREIARRYEVEPSTITRRAKKEDWARDYSEEVRQRTRAGLIELAQQTAQHDATESNKVLRDGIEVAVETNLAVIRAHLAGIKSSTARLDRLTLIFDGLVGSAESFSDIAKASSSFESLVRAQKTLVAMEREAIGIDDKKKGDGDGPTVYNMSF